MGLHAHVEIERGDLRVVADLDVADGERLALLGPNGAGKSTVVEALAGLLPLEGSIELDGERIDDLQPETRRVGVCFQDDLLFPRLSAIENVAFPLRARGQDRRAARNEAASLLRRLAPTVAQDAKPSALSGGERQRVALARALVAEPRLLLLDEPLANVDVSARPELRSLLREVTGSFAGATVLVAHDPLDALTLADTVVIMESGRVTQSGTPDEIRRTPRSGYAAELVGVNLFSGTLVPLADGAARLDTAAGSIEVAPESLVPAGQTMLATLRPSDVALHTRPPEGSPRNVLSGPVVEVAIEGERARVRIDSSPPLTAEITAGSARRLGLSAGDRIWASFKAVEVSLHRGEETLPASSQ